MAEKPVYPFKVTHGSVLHLAVPMTLAYLSTPLLGLVDTAVVGQFGTPALIGGLAVGAVIIDLVFVTYNFLRSGTSGLTAQAYGARDEKEKQAILFRSLIIAFVSGMLMLILSPFILWAGLWFIESTPAVAEATSSYFLIRMMSAPFALGNYAMLGWLLGLARPKTTLALQIILNGSNILLSLYLGLYLEWQITGIAIATIIAEALAFCIGIILCWRLLDHSIRPSKKRILEKAAWIRLVNLNADIMIRSFALLFAFAYFTSQGAAFGEVTLAANAILMHFFLISGYFLDGLATAAEQIVGKAIGANYKPAFWRGFKLTLFWNTMMALCCAVIFLMFGNTIINLLTVSETVRTEANLYLLWAALIPLSGMLAFQLDGVFIGATWSRDMSIMMVISLLLYLISWQLLKAPMGNHGLWLALHLFVMFRALTLGVKLKPNAQKTFSSI